MHLGIYTLQETLFESDIKQLTATTTVGEVTILDHHIPLVSVLQGPAVRLIDTLDKESIIKITSGFLEVREQGEVIILAERSQ
ncbi:MAG: hypothetical protein HZA36_00355 [Parcubacteria group bacterium]|nr:hypothetical protein [Parcubacteria group bacterium]